MKSAARLCWSSRLVQATSAARTKKHRHAGVVEVIQVDLWLDRKAALVFHILWSILVGFIVGLIARWLVPGGDQMGFLATTLLGIAGSIVGGLLAGVLRKPEPG